MNREYDVVGIGCCALDITVEVDGYPDADQKVAARSLSKQGVGLVATALVAAARLGGSCAFIAALGDDFLAQFVVDELDRERVDTRYVRRVPGKSVITAVIVADSTAGTRTIVYDDSQQPDTAPEQVTADIIGKSKALHIDNYQKPAALRGAEIARSLGVPVTVDLEGSGQEADDLLALCDYAIVPLEFVQGRFGAQDMHDGARALFDAIASHGGRAAVVTDGTAGSYLKSRELGLFQPAYRVPVVDTTGCGDVFHGAFALGVARGWPLEKIMRVASATAALKCRKPGGRAGIPSLREVESFLESAEPLR